MLHRIEAIISRPRQSLQLNSYLRDRRQANTSKLIDFCTPEIIRKPNIKQIQAN